MFKSSLTLKLQFFLYLITTLLIINVTGCTQNKDSEVKASKDGLSASLPSGVIALASDANSLMVDVIVDDGAPQACNNLQVDLAAGTFSCDLVLSTGQHTLSLLHSIMDNKYGKVQLAVISGIKVNILGGQSTAADFSTVLPAYTDDDGDSISNIKELEVGYNPFIMNPPPTFTSSLILSMSENNQQVAVVLATDVDDRAILYRIVGGDDQNLFRLDVDTGELVFVKAPDFEKPTDTGNNNTYSVLINASNDLNSTEQTVNIEVTNIDESPVISSNASVTIAENNLIVTTIVASDPEQDPVIISVSGGSDQAQFSLDNGNAQLTFKSAPDFETPQDTNLDNIYVVQVAVTAGGKMIQQSITVTVTDSNEAPMFTAPTDFTMPENTQNAATLTATDPEKASIIYSLGNGLDNALFTIGSTTGQLAFINVPDFETPLDTDTNNVYQLDVSVSDSVIDVRKNITVTVTNVGVTESPLLQVSADAKQLNFSWNTVSEATHYRLLENPDGVSGFTQISPDLSTQQHTQEIAVHRLDWFNASYIVDACDANGCISATAISVDSVMLDAVVYGKASNTGTSDFFGYTVALSGDGNTLAVGVRHEDSNASGINPPIGQSDNSAGSSGAVYVFVRNNGKWQQQAYVKASNTGANDWFGISIALSLDGNTLAVGASTESSNAIGINPPTGQSDNSASASGAVYVFQRNNGKWQQQAYVKASNTEGGDGFGDTVALSGDGKTLAVGAAFEDSNALGIPISPTGQSNNSASASGAVYVFQLNASTWQQQAYIKASNTESSDYFGRSVALSGNGSTLVVGADGEASNAIGINPPTGQIDNSAGSSGAVYVFQRNASNWQQQAYIKASNTESFDFFGSSVVLSGDGNTLIVSAYGEDSNAIGINSPTGQSNNSAGGSGAVYVFQRNIGNWQQQAYVKASNTEKSDSFGRSVALSGNGNTLAVGATAEGSNATGINAPSGQSDNSASNSGAAYVFQLNTDTWQQQAYVKASNTQPFDSFGNSVSLSDDGNTLAVSAVFEDSNVIGINSPLNNQNDNSANNSGVVYLY